MVVFQDIQDVEEWLEPLDYFAFWEAIAPYRLGVDDREHCDGLISSGKMQQASLLGTLKWMAMMELRMKFGLKDRVAIPLSARYAGSVH